MLFSRNWHINNEHLSYEYRETICQKKANVLLLMKHCSIESSQKNRSKEWIKLEGDIILIFYDDS